jgi:hypothetical protein
MVHLMGDLLVGDKYGPHPALMGDSSPSGGFSACRG